MNWFYYVTIIKNKIITKLNQERYNIFMTHMNMCNISLVLYMNWFY